MCRVLWWQRVWPVAWGVEWLIEDKIEQEEWTEAQKYPWRKTKPI